MSRNVQANVVRRRGASAVAPLAVIVLAAFVLAVIFGLRQCRDRIGGGGGDDEPVREEDLDTLLATPPAATQPGEGIAVAILVDTSGSMSGTVEEAGKQAQKIDVARRAVSGVVRQLERYAKDTPGRPVRVSIYEFSDRVSAARARQVLPFAAPDAAAADRALGALSPNGGTPIGEAMVKAKRDLDATALAKRHLLVVTDGENTEGVSPDKVMTRLAKLPDGHRPGVYFIAFDVAASVFQGVKDAGALVLPAANAADLQRALDSVINEQVLIE